mmetsp:Transcript_3258/g.7755  ORF Transcript_3258/g.7755 Transcript_3258/m.7755 type:complete len:457 (+) Transcript_3258:23-1393(+)
MAAALPPVRPPPFAPPSSPSKDYDAASVFLGLLLAIGAAAGIGISMVTQRYALSSLSPQVRMWRCGHTTRFRAWFFGLFLYGAANGLQAASQTLGPLFLMGGVFTLLLVFNMVFARLILSERITRSKVAGSATIITGVVFTVLAAPSEVKIKYSGKETLDLLARPVGCTYLVFLLLALLGSIAAMAYMENKYPTEDLHRNRQRLGQRTPERHPVAARAVPLGIIPDVLVISAELSRNNSFSHRSHNSETAHHTSHKPHHRRISSAPLDSLRQIRELALHINEGHPLAPIASRDPSNAQLIGEQSTAKNTMWSFDKVKGSLSLPALGSISAPGSRLPSKPPSPRMFGENAGSIDFEPQSDRQLSDVERPLSLAPARLEAVMGFVYPLSLGLDEGCAQVSLRAWLLIISNGDLDSTGAWLMPILVSVWVVFSLATVVYVRLVFKRYVALRGKDAPLAR